MFTLQNLRFYLKRNMSDIGKKKTDEIIARASECIDKVHYSNTSFHCLLICNSDLSYISSTTFDPTDFLNVLMNDNVQINNLFFFLDFHKYGCKDDNFKIGNNILNILFNQPYCDKNKGSVYIDYEYLAYLIFSNVFKQDNREFREGVITDFIDSLNISQAIKKLVCPFKRIENQERDFYSARTIFKDNLIHTFFLFFEDECCCYNPDYSAELFMENHPLASFVK